MAGNRLSLALAIIMTFISAIASPLPANSISTKDAAGQLLVTFINTLSSNDVHIYITGNLNGQSCFIQADGSCYTPPNPTTIETSLKAADIGIKLGGGYNSTVQALLPMNMDGVRIYASDRSLDFRTNPGAGVAALSQPSVLNTNDAACEVNWSWVELTMASGQIWANPTMVDFVGLPLAMKLESSGEDDEQEWSPGLRRNAVELICKDMQHQSKMDGQPWDQLCRYNSAGNLMRVISPDGLISTNASAFEGYFDGYIQQLMARFAGEPLTIRLPEGGGNVTCKADAAAKTLSCSDGSIFSNITAADIFSCSSANFAAVGTSSRCILCAAFNRATLLLPEGSVQPGVLPGQYYQPGLAANHYSASVHRHSANGEGYAFPDDDIVPNSGSNTAGYVSSDSPRKLILYVGGAPPCA